MQQLELERDWAYYIEELYLHLKHDAPADIDHEQGVCYNFAKRYPRESPERDQAWELARDKLDATYPFGLEKPIWRNKARIRWVEETHKALTPHPNYYDAFWRDFLKSLPDDLDTSIPLTDHFREYILKAGHIVHTHIIKVVPMYCPELDEFNYTREELRIDHL